MIRTIKHKGLGRFYHTGNLSGIQAHHARRLQLILTRLDSSACPEDMDLPGLHFSPEMAIRLSIAFKTR